MAKCGLWLCSHKWCFGIKMYNSNVGFLCVSAFKYALACRCEPAQFGSTARSTCFNKTCLQQIFSVHLSVHVSFVLSRGFRACRRAQLNHLKEREATRSEMFEEMLSAYAREGVQGVEAQGPVIQQRLVHLKLRDPCFLKKSNCNGFPRARVESYTYEYMQTHSRYMYICNLCTQTHISARNSSMRLCHVCIHTATLHSSVQMPITIKERENCLVPDDAPPIKDDGTCIHACTHHAPMPDCSQVSLLLKLLDNFLMPDDVPPIKNDGTDDWVYTLPGRKDDKQLHRLALANAEAEGECLPPQSGVMYVGVYAFPGGIDKKQLHRLALVNAEAQGECLTP
eukprot:896519-Pelagomonas_calceolata.AAC.1